MGPARLSGRRRGPEPAIIGGSLALLGAVVLLVLFFGAKFWAESQRAEIDEASLCPKSGATAVTAVLVDRSDPLGPQQSQRVRQVLDRTVAEVPVGGKIALYLAEADDFERLAPVLALCNPGSEANPLYQNPKRMRARYEEQFKKRLDTVIEALLRPSPRKTSPIMESIKAVCIDAFGAVPANVPLRLLVVSDLLQHSPIASHYRDKNFENFLKDPKMSGVLVDCKGADVEVIYVLRLGKDGRPTIQNRAHQRFWDLYFQRLNARPRSLEAV
ncbi:MAG: hypothetical protein RMK73_07865 [Geminicoccaceae bacterium]|nr:hypothetical protein [Geminicoccaceae bacterium]MDW8124492.1 hypothetical protein [Geminicoccaceae bacterium]MDW8341380.1 hypothetical protein [Geminicoccaceae bacterium]